MSEEKEKLGDAQEHKMICPFYKYKWRMPDPLPNSVSCPDRRKPISILHQL